jgi:hypothetical protein
MYILAVAARKQAKQEVIDVAAGTAQGDEEPGAQMQNLAY